MHALALLVDFSDNTGNRPKADFQKLLFDATNPNSMTSYYSKISGGRITVTGDVKDWMRAPKKYTDYTDGDSGMSSNFPHNTPGLLQDMLTKFCATDTLTRFDTDGDGYVDGIFLIHAGTGAEAERDVAKRKGMIWSHKWVLPTPFLNGGVKVFAYSTEPEDGRVGVFAHEFGHVLGLPDLYDTTNRSEGVGEWCLMGAGSWAGGGDTPSRMSPWCLDRLGLLKPQNVAAAGTLTIPTLEADPRACYRISIGGATGPEYFLIENRQQSGMDIGLQSQKPRVPSGNLSEVAASDSDVCTSEPGKRQKRGADGGARPTEPKGPGDFAAALVMIAGLPLSDAEKAEAVRRLLGSGTPGGWGSGLKRLNSEPSRHRP